MKKKKEYGQKRQIVKRLKNYRAHKIQQGASKNTIQNYFTKIKTFYRDNGIEIPYIPPTNINKKYHERFEEIPTIKHIKQALKSTKNIKHKAIFLFMRISGTAMAEILSLTV
jgi:hypothetical protein